MYLNRTTSCIMYDECEVPRADLDINTANKEIEVYPNVYCLDEGETQEVTRILNESFKGFNVSIETTRL